MFEAVPVQAQADPPPICESGLVAGGGNTQLTLRLSCQLDNDLARHPATTTTHLSHLSPLSCFVQTPSPVTRTARQPLHSAHHHSVCRGLEGEEREVVREEVEVVECQL